MPSTEHKGLVLLVRNRPQLAAELLRDALHIALPDYGDVELYSEDATEVMPAVKSADAVVVLYSTGRVRRRVLAIIVEVQRGRDGKKRKSWPVYLTSTWSRLGCPAILLVICPRTDLAGWCRRPIDLGHPGWALTPLVAELPMIPVIVDDKEAVRSPELAVLSAIAHGSDPQGSDVLHALLTAIRGIDPARASQYADVVLALLQGAAKHEWEDLLKTGTYEYQSDFARRYVAEGKAEGLAEAILDVLAARGFEVPSDVRARIEVCTDVAQLGTWIKQAVTCGSVRDLFD